MALATSDPVAFFATFAACLACGFPAIVIDPLAAGPELRRIVDRSAPAAAVLDALTERALVEAGGDAIALPRLLVDDGTLGATGRGDWRPWRRRARPAASRQSFAEVAADDAKLHWADVDERHPAYVMFTSGTTSTPKGVVISRRALFRHVRTLAEVFGYGPDATLLHYLPFHHTDGLVHGPAAALLAGLNVVRPGPFTPQTAEAMPDLLRTGSVTHMMTVPTMLALLLRSFGDRPDLFRTDHFRHLVSTAGYLPDALWSRVEETFGLRVANFYGMTETVSGTLYCGPAEATYRRGTLGKPIDCTVRVVDENGGACTPGQVGRLEVAGDHLMDGYFADPEATAAVLHGGWLDTGDLVSIDDDGFVVFVGRRKTIIKRGGITIYPEDVKHALESIPWVREAEVVGMADPTFEQIVVACVVLDGSGTAAEVHSECARRLAPERRPDRVVVLDALPRGPSGKVQRDALLDRAAATTDDAGPTTELPAIVRSVAARILQVDESTLSDATTPDDVPNWDSYAQIELAMALEKRFALRFTPKELMQMRSLGHIVTIVGRRRALSR